MLIKSDVFLTSFLVLFFTEHQEASFIVQIHVVFLCLMNFQMLFDELVRVGKR